jgi:N-acyl-D-aspartate/D-glutamate deacylase
VLGRNVRELGRFDLATAIHRMTGRPADVLGLTDRGRIAQGLVADLALFDPATVADRSTYDSPTLAPVGVEMVVVGGRVAVEQGRAVDLGLGRVLRRTVSGRRPPRRS